MAQLRNKKKSFQRILIRITFLSTKKLFLYFKYDLRIVPITFVKSLIRLFLTSKIESKFQLSQFGNFRIRESENSDSPIHLSCARQKQQQQRRIPIGLISCHLPPLSASIFRAKGLHSAHTPPEVQILFPFTRYARGARFE